MIELFDRTQFYMTFPSVPEPVVEVWRVISGYLGQNRALPNQFEVSQIYGHTEKYHTTKRLKLSSSEIETLIEKRELDGFAVDAGSLSRGMAFKLYPEGESAMQSRLSSLIASKSKAPNDWGPMLEQLMNSFPATGAWQWRGHYRNWQGCQCVEMSYEALYGELPPGLRTSKESSVDGFLPERTLIDISLNPGRSKQLSEGSEFYATAEMWLGPDFWQYAKCSREEVLAADFFIEKRDTPDFLYLKSWPEAFSRPDGEQGRMQQRLWKLFFHEDCEWPPGSGGISDEPMYGPAELMPGREKTSE